MASALGEAKPRWPFTCWTSSVVTEGLRLWERLDLSRRSHCVPTFTLTRQPRLLSIRGPQPTYFTRKSQKPHWVWLQCHLHLLLKDGVADPHGGVFSKLPFKECSKALVDQKGRSSGLSQVELILCCKPFRAGESGGTWGRGRCLAGAWTSLRALAQHLLSLMFTGAHLGNPDMYQWKK